MVKEKILIVKDVPQSNPCKNCEVCLRLKLMELGFISGQKIRVIEYQKDLCKVTLLDEYDNPVYHMGMRKDEFERILVEENCVIQFE
jgi:Fe2+ transport system protein FeoA